MYVTRETKKERKLKLKCGRELAKAQGYLSIYLSIKFNHKKTSEGQTKNKFYRIYSCFSFALHDLKIVVFKEQLNVVFKEQFFVFSIKKQLKTVFENCFSEQFSRMTTN